MSISIKNDVVDGLELSAFKLNNTLEEEKKEVAQQIMNALEGQTVHEATEILNYCLWAIGFVKI